MRKFLGLTGGIMLVFTLASCEGKAAEALAECLKVGKPATITGTLRQRDYFGPPGFGEDTINDERIKGYFLVPINGTVCSDSTEFGDGEATSIQLSSAPPANLIDSVVTISGEWWHSDNGNWQGEVVITPASVSLANTDLR